MILPQNVYTIVSIFAEGKGSFLNFFIRKWIDCGIISVGQLFGPDGYLTYNEFKAKFHNVNTDYSLYEGVISAIKFRMER